jgi:hypothetical protein
MRTFKNCYGSLEENIIKKLNPDIFLHTWSEVGSSTKSNGKSQYSRVSEKELQDLYGAKKIVIEDFDVNYFEEKDGVNVPDELKKAEPVHYKGSIPMFYKIYYCDQLRVDYEKRIGTKYDFVIRIRPDLFINEPIPDYVFKDPNLLWNPIILINPQTQVCDKIAVGGCDVMKYYSGVWPKLNEYWQNPLGNGEWKDHRVGERLMKHHFEISNFQYNYFFLDAGLMRNDKTILKSTGWKLKTKKILSDFKYKYNL